MFLIQVLNHRNDGYTVRARRNVNLRVVRAVDHLLLRLNRFVLNVQWRQCGVDRLLRLSDADSFCSAHLSLLLFNLDELLRLLNDEVVDLNLVGGVLTILVATVGREAVHHGDYQHNRSADDPNHHLAHVLTLALVLRVSRIDLLDAWHFTETSSVVNHWTIENPSIL